MLNPWMLYFLPLALVPIILHLITLLRLRTVELSTFAFLIDTRRQQRRHLLLEMLLMALRGLFIALIVLALARPVARRAGILAGSGSERDVILVFDAGPTMALRAGASSCLERGKTVARKIVGFLDARDHLTLIRAAHEPDQMLRGFVGAYPGVNRTIDSIDISAASANLASAMEMALEPEARGKRTLYLITDGNGASWPPLKDHRLRLLLNGNIRIVVMNVGPTEPIHNRAIIGDTPPNAEAVAGLPTVLEATVLNSSDTKRVDTVLSISLEGEQVQRSHIELAPGQKRTVPVTVTPLKAGILQGRFELPGDSFPLDDTFLFSLNVGPAVRVLILAPPIPENMQTDPAVFLQTALETPSDLLGRQAASEEGEGQGQAAAIKATLVRLPKLDIAMLREAEVIILADVPIGKELASSLRQVVAEGTGLILFSGTRMNPAVYQELLLAHIPASPLELLPSNTQSSGDEKPQLVSAVDLAHPILRIFDEGGQDYFVTTRLYRHVPIRLSEAPLRLEATTPDKAEEQAAARSLFMLAGGRSVMAESRFARGKVLVAGIGVSLDLSDLVVKPEFVPLLLRSVTHVRRPPPVQIIPPLSAAQPAVIRITDRWPHAHADGINPADRKHPVKLHRSGDTFSGAMMATDQKGYYAFRAMPRHKAAPQIIKRGFAVNLAPGPSAFVQVEEKAIRERLSPSQLTVLEGPVEDISLIGQLTGKKELWRTLVWIMFAVFAVEFLLATFRTSLPQTGESPSLLQRAWLRRILAPWRMSAPTREATE
ncbi:MAG: BatA domain-containing protein [Planctomycetota bacterium]|jgi:hypothetical protein|nr:BatA domain-containing protein [Planctomycetota bacterium]